MKKKMKPKTRKATLLGGAVAMAAIAALNLGGKDAFSNGPPDQDPLATKDLMIMKYSRMPSSVTVQAWADPKFRERLTQNPHSILYDVWQDSINLNFIVHPDMERIRNYCLPFLPDKVRSMRPKEIVDILQREIGDSVSLDYFLPLPVMVQALLDDAFRARLVKDPNTVLQGMGYSLEQSMCVIHVDTKDTRNLTLKSSPNNIPQLSELDTKISQTSSCGGGCHGGSTKCCATGTCGF